MTDIQTQLLKLLNEIGDICSENGIDYFIDGGTALGAIRHRGFLPWDDDIDIFFTRDNWNKFLDAFRSEDRPGRVIEDLHTNKDYTMVYARYCDTTSTCILRTSMIDQFRSGLFIDLFVLDPVPDNEESVEEYFEILGGYCEYLNPYYYDTVVGDNPWYYKFVEMGAEHGREYVIKYVEDRLFSGRDEDGMIYCFRFDLFHYVYPRRVIGRPRLVPFENIMAPVPEDTDEFLRIHYTDKWYMIPELQDQETHNVVIDLDVPYEQFVGSYINLIDHDDAVNNYRTLQKLRLKKHTLTKEIDTGNYEITARVFASMLNVRCAGLGTSLEDLLKARRYDELHDIFGNYYSIQLHKYYFINKVLVPLTDEQLYCAMYLLLTDGGYPKADKVIRLRRRVSSEPLSDKLAGITDIVEAIRDIARFSFRGEYDRAYSIAREGFEKHPDIPDFFEGYVRAGCALCSTKEQADELNAVIDAQSEAFRSMDRVAAASAFLKLRFTDERDAAAEELAAIDSRTRNGMLKLEIMDTLKEYGYGQEQ